MGGRAGEMVWEVERDELPGFQLLYMTGLQRLSKGNIVMSTWLGQGKLGGASHVIEVAREKKVVWTSSDHRTVEAISSIRVLEASVMGKVTH